MAKNIKQIPQKVYWDVKVESMVPCTIIYRVYAETPEEAAEMIKVASPTSVKHKLAGKKNLKIAVYQAGTTLLKFIKNLL